jgi:hypothetical protein
MLSVSNKPIMLSDVMLSVIMLSVVVPSVLPVPKVELTSRYSMDFLSSDQYQQLSGANVIKLFMSKIYICSP